jgi:hypothetical protein
VVSNPKSIFINPNRIMQITIGNPDDRRFTGVSSYQHDYNEGKPSASAKAFKTISLGPARQSIGTKDLYQRTKDGYNTNVNRYRD